MRSLYINNVPLLLPEKYAAKVLPFRNPKSPDASYIDHCRDPDKINAGSVFRIVRSPDIVSPAFLTYTDKFGVPLISL